MPTAASKKNRKTVDIYICDRRETNAKELQQTIYVLKCTTKQIYKITLQMLHREYFPRLNQSAICWESGWKMTIDLGSSENR